MIPSVDTHVYNKLTKYLKIILSECYIIDEVLKDFDPEVVQLFKKAYTGTTAKHEVTVRYAFPNVSESYLAGYVIQIGAGQESNKSLGGIQGAFNFEDAGVVTEDLQVQSGEDPRKLYLIPSKPIGEIIGIPNISFSKRDKLRVQDHVITFTKEGNEFLEGKKVSIQYSSKAEPVGGSDPVGTERGFSVSENLVITAFSNNIDTVRCLDAILKTILIMIRYTEEEQTYYGLPQVAFSYVKPVITDGDSIIYGRAVTLSYSEVSYSVSYRVTQDIKEIIMRTVSDSGSNKS